MVGTKSDPIQIDESKFAGRRKYNHGRILNGDRAAAEEDPTPVDNHRNHGQRIDGPWVFGLIKGSDVRYFYVLKRDAATLIPIIQREVSSGSCICSAEWPTCRGLTCLGYMHKTVNHQQHYVDPVSRAHTNLSKDHGWVQRSTF